MSYENPLTSTSCRISETSNYYARRKFALLKSLLEHIGIEPERLHFSWISSSEAAKFVDVTNTITAKVKALSPAKRRLTKLLSTSRSRMR